MDELVCLKIMFVGYEPQDFLRFCCFMSIYFEIANGFPFCTSILSLNYLHTTPHVYADYVHVYAELSGIACYSILKLFSLRYFNTL